MANADKDEQRLNKLQEKARQARYRSEFKGDTKMNNYLERRASNKLLSKETQMGYWPNASKSKTGDALSGRTVEAGTGSMLKALKGFLGGGLRSSGR
jgi:hypothetical protein